MATRRWLILLALAVVGLGIWRVWPSAVTDPDSSTRLEGLSGTSSGSMESPSGHATSSSVAAAAVLDAGETPLDRLPLLAGDVVDESGSVAQAEVAAELRSTDEPKECERTGRTRSVAGGSFELGPLCPGQYDLKALRGPMVATAVVRLSRGRDPQRITLQLRAGTRLEVQVRDAKKTLVPDAAIEVQDEVGGYLAHAVTDAKGFAMVEGLAPRRHTITARKDGFLSATLQGRPLALGTDRVELVLVAGAKLDGLVTDVDGLPLSETSLRLGTRLKQLNGGLDSQVDGETRDGGAFSLGPVLPGSYLLVASHKGYRRLEQTVRVPGPKVTLALTQGTILEGTFVDADGDPIEQAHVQGKLGYEDSFDVELNAGGFHAEGLSDGEWTLLGMAQRADGGAQGLAVGRVKVKGERRLQVTLALEHGETLSGRCLTDPGGGPATTDVIVIEERLHRKLLASGLNAATVRPGLVMIANCAGTFAATGLKPGRYHLVACGNDEDPPSASAGATDAIVNCPADGQLRFRVVDSAGRPLTRYFVGRGEGALEDHPDGRYERKLNRDLDEELAIRAPGFALLQRHLKAKRSEQLDLGNLTMTAPRRLEGAVLDQNQEPVAGADVRFQFDDRDALFRTRTQPDGTFEFADIPAEASTVFVRHDEFDVAEKAVSATQPRVEIVLVRSLQLTGTVITSDGRPALDYQVAGWAAAPLSLFNRCPVQDGRYQCNVDPGEWKLRLVSTSGRGRLSGFSPITVTVTGAPGQTADFVERIGGASFDVFPVDEDGQPILAEVWLVRGERTPPTYTWWMEDLEKTEGIRGDPEQAFHVFSHVPAGRWTVVVHVTKMSRTMWMTFIDVAPGMPSQLKLAMPPDLAPYPVPTP